MLGFTIVDNYEGPGSWYDKDSDQFGFFRNIHVATDQYGTRTFTSCPLAAC